MAQVLKQGIAVNAHDSQHSQREQGHGHDNNFYGAGDREPHQLRVARQNQQEPSFYGISQLQHTTENLARVRVIRRDGEHVVVRFFVHFRRPNL